jgi:hypothetical protein
VTPGDAAGRRRERLLVAALGALATYVFFFEYLPPFSRVHVFSDLEVYHYPLERYSFEAIRHGRLPQWDASMYCGISFVGNVQAGLFYPPTWLVYAVNWGQPVLRFQPLEWLVFAHVWLAFLLCYCWLRARGMAWLASVLGGGVFAFGGYSLWQIVHLGVATALPWTPLAFWGIDDAVEGREWRPLWKTVLASALSFLAGYPPSWAAFCITVFVYALASRGRWRAAAGAAGAVAASLLLAMVQVLPALEARATMYREPRYTGEARSAILPLLVANWVDGNRSSSLHYLKCIYQYLGVAAIFALVWAVGRRRWRPYLQPLVVMGVCLFLVLDPRAVVYWTIVWIPVLESTLQSYNFYEGVTAMAALMTAIAVSDFLDSRAARAAPRWLMPGATAAMAGWSARQAAIWAGGGRFASGGQAAVETLAAAAVFALALWVWRGEHGPRRAVLAGAVILFALCDYKVYGTDRLFNTRDGDVDRTYDPGRIRGVSGAAYAAMQANRQYRVTSDGAPGAVDFRMWGLATPQGLDPFLPGGYREFVKRWGRFQTSRVFLVDYGNDAMLQALGVRYAITYRGGASETALAGNRKFRRVGPDSFYQVYEYLEARPPYGWDGGAGDARPTEWMPERRVFRVNSERGGRFGLVEQFYPGWHATVDGKPVPVERWRGLFQAAPVAGGEHTVAFEYRSRWLRPGAAISLGALAALAWIIAGRGRGNAPALPRFRIRG